MQIMESSQIIVLAPVDPSRIIGEEANDAGKWRSFTRVVLVQ